MTIRSIYLLICSILQNKLLKDGAKPFHQLHTHICCQRTIFLLRNMFKFLGHTLFLEVCPTSKEIMLFYDNGFVLMRFAGGVNESSIDGTLRDVKVD